MQRGLAVLPSLDLMVSAPNPVIVATTGFLALSLLVAMALTVVIKRREAARVAAQPQAPAIQIQRIQRATSADLPDAMQKRLRMLTAELDKSLSEAAGTAPASAQQPPIAPPAQTRAASVPAESSEPPPYVPDDKTDFFGDPSLGGPFDQESADHPEDATNRLEDATSAFYGFDADADEDATHVFREEDDTSIDPREFFGEDSVPLAEAPAQDGDATRFFGLEDNLGAEDSVAEPVPAQTKFFTPDELEDDAKYASRATDGFTGMLQALPPGLASSVTGVPSGPLAAPDDEPFLSTGALQALPRSPSRADAATIDRVRACLASPQAPEVVALTVLDGTGEVLAGEADQDLIGELRSLLEEAAMGSAADIDQPVRLGDDSHGALLLVPTGVNALLGALVLETGDPAATRAGLRRLARQIGDAMRRAS